MKVDAILTADWHLRETQPTCRVDDFWKAQWKNVAYIANLQKKYDCPVLHAGDLFHHWKPSPYLLANAMKSLPKEFYTVYGNHDLPYHRITHKEKSGVFALQMADALYILPGCHYGDTPTSAYSGSLGECDKSIMVWHKFVWYKKEPFPGVDPKDQALRVIKKYGYDLMLTGDNHIPFVVRTKSGKLLVNPGPITRQTAKDLPPRVYLWNGEENTVEAHSLPCDPSAVSKKHIERVKKREGMLSAFVEKLDTNWDVELSFSRNLELFEKKNMVHKRVMDVVHQAISPEAETDGAI